MIELHGVTMRVPGGTRLLFDELELEASTEAGEVAIVTGAVGCGKSSLLALLYGGTVADAGRVTVFGHDVRRLRRSSITLLRRRLGIMTQALDLLDNRSALANVAIALEVRGESPRKARVRAAEALGRVGLGDVVDARCDQLSQGEAQRVALARAIVGDPSLVLLDEPTSHQDDVGRELVTSVLRDYPGLVATSDPAMVSAATMHGWRHLELAGGTLAEVDRHGVTITSEDARAIAGEITEHHHGDNIVPFPRRSVS
jgi:putative ABC transport system ATP-binding protein